MVLKYIEYNLFNCSFKKLSYIPLFFEKMLCLVSQIEILRSDSSELLDFKQRWKKIQRSGYASIFVTSASAGAIVTLLLIFISVFDSCKDYQS